MQLYLERNINSVNEVLVASVVSFPADGAYLWSKRTLSLFLMKYKQIL